MKLKVIELQKEIAELVNECALLKVDLREAQGFLKTISNLACDRHCGPARIAKRYFETCDHDWLDVRTPRKVSCSKCSAERV
jgi:hypothetical protein